MSSVAGNAPDSRSSQLTQAFRVPFGRCDGDPSAAMQTLKHDDCVCFAL